MNRICEEIYWKKVHEGRMSAESEGEFEDNLKHLVSLIADDGGITKDAAWELFKRLDSIRSISQEQIDQVLKESGVSFKTTARSSPGIVPNKDPLLPFDFLYLLCARKEHEIPCRRREGKSPILTTEEALRIHERIQKAG